MSPLIGRISVTDTHVVSLDIQHIVYEKIWSENDMYH